ncbi:MAG: tyrosine-type recombinase/integrase [Bacteroidota bacterium]
MDDIHGYKQKAERYLRILERSTLTAKNQALVRKFAEDCYSDGISHGRVQKYLFHLINVGRLKQKDFDVMDVDDVKGIVRQIELNPNYKENTKRDYRIAIKKFYKWLGNGTPLPCASWIKTGAKHSKNILPEELLTESDVRDMVNASDNPRDKAFVFVLYESGCRIGELMNVKLKNVVFDKYGAQLIVNGKTGSRRIRIIYSTDYLRYWIENHPNRSDLEAHLWVNLSNAHRGEPQQYAVMHKRLHAIARKAGVRKKVNFHNFRHSRATYLADKLTEAQLCEIFGWKLGSKMPATYVHLSGRNVDDALLRIHGLKEKGEEERIVCPRCSSDNDRISRYCAKCGLPFGIGFALKAEQERGRNDELMSRLMQDQGVMEAISKAIDKFGLRR